MDVDATDQNKPKVTYDPGWNDPPLFSYDAAKSISQPAKRGTLLNKRVAFPMGGNAPAHVTSATSDAPLSRPPVTLPPTPPVAVPSPGLPSHPASACETQAASGLASCDNQEALTKGVDVLCQLVESLPADDKREKEDIKKRLDVLRKMCEDDKLNKNVYGRLIQLANSLQNGDTTTASNIQAGLMVDHVSLCSSWMAGVRLLVRRIADPDA